MSMFNYSSLAEGDKPVQDLKTKLNNAVGQAIPYVVIGKAKRTSGESVKPIEFGFENGQKVTFMVRQMKAKLEQRRQDQSAATV